MDRRSLPLEGSVNFRDLGGYATTDGRVTTWGTLFRADGLNRLTEADVALVEALGLHTVIDLRTTDEAEQRGRFPVDRVPVTYHALPLTDVLPATEDLPDWDQAAYVADRYLAMVTEGGAVLTAAIEAMAGAEALPVVFHCSAGKDRTGVLSALLLTFFGVPDETIVADYALSAAAMERLLAKLLAEYPESADEVRKYAPAILNVRPETMELFLASLRREFGPADSLAASLGVTEAVASLQAAVLGAG